MGRKKLQLTNSWRREKLFENKALHFVELRKWKVHIVVVLWIRLDLKRTNNTKGSRSGWIKIIPFDRSS